MNPHEFDSTNPEHIRERLAALGHEGELEVLHDDGRWRPRTMHGLPLEPDARYRPATESEIIQYSLETFPVDLLRVKEKDENGLWTIRYVTIVGVCVEILGDFSFKNFLEKFVQCDGSPCGVKKV